MNRYSDNVITSLYPNRIHDASGYVSDLAASNTARIGYKSYCMKNHIKKLRLQAQLSQQALADKVGGGATKATIQKLETGKMRLTTVWMARIARGLNLESPTLLIEENHMTQDIRPSEAALLYAIKEIIGMMMHKRRATKKNLIEDLGRAREFYSDAGQPTAVLVMDNLLAHVKDETRPTQQQLIDKMLQLSPPKLGSNP